MMTLLNAALLLHGTAIAHVHPHEAVALIITFIMAIVVGARHAILTRQRRI